jgi:hypothetical protein
MAKYSNPYPKFHRPENSEATGKNYPDLNLGRMREVAERNNQDHSNLSNPDLNRIDKHDGSIKGGC